MKICLPTNGKNGLSETVHNHFGSAGYFTIYDSETKGVQVIENDNQHHAHGACQPLRKISGMDVNAVLTSGMGQRAVQLLNQGGIKIYLLAGETVQQAIDKFSSGELIELTFNNACGGHGYHE
ncbi:MAG TPA: NifB/NifX family molybdenum-iron cluster-binding protein [Patescibacteria group bacterium]|nr:NifB/NifX family molybdenum-iron cluster-binding protein [Patescibacteria group bacterium]